MSESIVIRVSETGALIVSRNLRNVGESARASAGGVDTLKRALGAIATVLAVRQVAAYADAWAVASGQIRIATKNIHEATAVQDELFKIAQKVGTGYSDMTRLYSRASRSAKDLGASQADVIKFTEGVGKALVIQGTSSAQASGALLQLGQALSGATIQSQEFNSLIDGTPVILQTVARGLEGVNGSVGELTRRVKNGEVTSKEFFDAFLTGMSELDKDYEKSSTTIGQGIAIVANSLQKYIGEMDKAIGGSATFVSAARWVADNIDQLAGAALVAASAIGTMLAIQKVTAFGAALASLVALNPFLLLAASIAGATTYLMLFGDEIDAGIDGVTSMKSVTEALGQKIAKTWRDLPDMASEAWDGVFGVASETNNAITENVKESASWWVSEFNEFFSDVGPGFMGVATAAARMLDAFVSVLTSLGIATKRIFEAIPLAFVSVVKAVYNEIAIFIEDIVNVAVGGVNKIRALTGQELIGYIHIDRKDIDKKGLKSAWGGVRNSFKDGFASVSSFYEKGLKGALDGGAGKSGGSSIASDAQAIEISKIIANAIAEANKEKVDLAAGASGGTAGAVGSSGGRSGSRGGGGGGLSEMQKAYQDFTRLQSDLDRQLASGAITIDEYNQKLAELRAGFDAASNPIAKINQEIDEQIKLAGMNSKAREVETQLMQYTAQLTEQGIVLAGKELAALREKLQTLQKVNEVMREQDSILEATVGSREKFINQITAIQNLLNDSSSGFKKNDAYAAIGGIFGEMFEGTSEWFALQLANHQQMYEQIDLLRQNDLISEQTANQMKLKYDADLYQKRLQNVSDFFGNLSQLSRSENRVLANIGKAAAVTQATIDGVVAVQKALASAPPPTNYALAAAVGIATASNVAEILGVSTAFMTGGSFKVGGTGGTDSQMVAFRATPGEQVSIATPQQVRKGDPYQGVQSSAQPEVNIKNINVLDPNLIGDYLSTDDGERLIMNIVGKNNGFLM